MLIQIHLDVNEHNINQNNPRSSFGGKVGGDLAIHLTKQLVENRWMQKPTYWFRNELAPC